MSDLYQRGTRRLSARTEYDHYWSRDAAGQVHCLLAERPPPTWLERACAPLFCGLCVAVMMMAAGLFGALSALWIWRTYLLGGH